MKNPTYTLSYEYSPNRLVFKCSLLNAPIYASTPRALLIRVQEKLTISAAELERLMRYALMFCENR